MKKKVVLHYYWWLSIPMQAATMVATIVIVLALLHARLTEFNTTDKRPQILPLVPTKDIGETGAVANVKVGMYLHDFSVFDMVKNKFVVDAIVWFQFDPTEISLESVGKFSFEKGTILRRTPPETKMINGDLFARYLVRVQLASTLDYKYFPVNDHNLYIILSNSSLSPSELRFRVNVAGVGVSKEAYTHSWKLVGKSVTAGYASAELDAFDPAKVVSSPLAAFIFDFEKRYVWRI